MMELAVIVLSSHVSVRTRISGLTLSMIVCSSATRSLFLSDRQFMFNSLSGLKLCFFLEFLLLLLPCDVVVGEEVLWGGPGLKIRGSSALEF